MGGVLYKCKGRTTFIENLEEGQYYLQRVYIKPEQQCKRIAQTAILLCEKEFPNAKCFLVDFPEDLMKNKRCYEKAGPCFAGGAAHNVHGNKNHQHYGQHTVYNYRNKLAAAGYLIKQHQRSRKDDKSQYGLLANTHF